MPAPCARRAAFNRLARGCGLTHPRAGRGRHAIYTVNRASGEGPTVNVWNSSSSRARRVLDVRQRSTSLETRRTRINPSIGRARRKYLQRSEQRERDIEKRTQRAQPSEARQIKVSL